MSMAPPPIPLPAGSRAVESPPSSQSQDYDFSQTQKDPVKLDEELPESLMMSSQANPRRKYWAVFNPLSSSGHHVQHQPIKLSWPLPPTHYGSSYQPELPGTSGIARIGRGPAPRFNDIVLTERRVSNRHCVIGRFDDRASGTGMSEPIVYIEDLASSNGTWVNGKRIENTPHRQILKHGDEISLGAQGELDDHDVRYIYRSVGKEGELLEEVGGIFQKYTFVETLGSGSFAEVKKAVEVRTGAVYAVKCITRHRFANNARTLQLFDREVQILESLDHENICRLIEVFDDPQHIYLVLEYVDGGDLLSYIMKHADPGPGLSEQQAAHVTTMICRAMAYTHSLGVAHRDLKPENILLSSDQPPIIKVADFGLAKMVDEGTALRTMVGTPQYLAPEVVMQTAAKPGYENIVDSWSVGVIVYSMLTNALPFDEDPDEPVNVRIRKRVEQPFDYDLLREYNISELGINFIECLLAKDPAKRMSLTDALHHSWLDDQALGGESLELSSDIPHYRHHVRNQHSIDAQSHTSTVHGMDCDKVTPQIEGSSVEDFSYPMHQLRLQTPATRTAQSGPNSAMSLDSPQALLAGQSSFFGGPSVAEDPDMMRLMSANKNPSDGSIPKLESQQMEKPYSVILQESPPSPPLSAQADVMDNLEDKANSDSKGLNIHVVDYVGVPPIVASVGPSPSVAGSTAFKRKLSNQASSTSSSSLSSVPDEFPHERKTPVTKVVTGTASSRRKKSTINVENNPPSVRSSARLREAARADLSPARSPSLRKRGKR